MEKATPVFDHNHGPNPIRGALNCPTNFRDVTRLPVVLQGNNRARENKALSPNQLQKV